MKIGLIFLSLYSDKSDMMTKNLALLSSLFLMGTLAFAQQKEDSAIYLNASSDSKPREISLGLPTSVASAVQIFEDGLTESYYVFPLIPYKSWYSGLGVEGRGTMTPMETAIRYGDINNYVDSYNRLGSDVREGRIAYTAGSFGQQKFDMNFTGPLKGGWKYSASIYQNVDPGSNASQIRTHKDRHRFYKAVVTKDFRDGKGYMSFSYKYVGFLTSRDDYGPFIFTGDGSVKPYNGFSMGTDSYIPELSSFKYKDFLTGEMKEHPYLGEDKSHHLSFILKRNFDNGMVLDVRSRFKTGVQSDASTLLAGIEEVGASDGYTYAGGSSFAGPLQRRNIYQFEGFEHSWLSNAELRFNSGPHRFRTGADVRLSSAACVNSSTNFAHEVGVDPKVLYRDGEAFYNFNMSGEYYDGIERKFALYGEDTFSPSRNLSLTGFVRAEYSGISGKSANNIGDDVSNTRTPGFSVPDGKVTPFKENNLNGSVGADISWRLAEGLSVNAEGILTRAHNGVYHYGGFYRPDTDPTDTRLVKLGVSYQNGWINVVSYLMYISQSNNNSRGNFQHALQKEVNGNPIGYLEMKSQPVKFGIESLGWITDAIITTSRNFSLHTQLTLKDPRYKNFVFSPTFSDGVTEVYDFSGKNVTGLYKFEFSVEPTYTTGDWRFWLTARYISRQYINKTNSLYFKGRCETFGGVDWKVYKNVRLSLNLINLLNQKGASGSIGSADLVEDASLYKDFLMSGSFIRPFTVEFKVSVDL